MEREGVLGVVDALPKLKFLTFWCSVHKTTPLKFLTVHQHLLNV